MAAPYNPIVKDENNGFFQVNEKIKQIFSSNYEPQMSHVLYNSIEELLKTLHGITAAPLPPQWQTAVYNFAGISTPNPVNEVSLNILTNKQYFQELYLFGSTPFLSGIITDMYVELYNSSLAPPNIWLTSYLIWAAGNPGNPYKKLQIGHAEPNLYLEQTGANDWKLRFTADANLDQLIDGELFVLYKIGDLP